MFSPPVASAGPRTPPKARLPKDIRDVLTAMVRGLPGDEQPVDFVTAAKHYHVAVDRARRWLHRGESVAFLRAERRRYRTELCSANEAHLARIRGGPNAAAAVRSVALLENLDRDDAQRGRREQVSPGLTIVIENRAPPRPEFISHAGDQKP